MAVNSFTFAIMTRLLLLLSLLLPAHRYAIADEVPSLPLLAAKSYVLLDYTSNQTLLSHNADERFEPASLTKLMTAYLTFDALSHGTLKLEQPVTVPAAAVSTGKPGDESRMLLQTGQTATVDALLHGLIVQSGNDAAITLAIHIAGSESGFVDLMNKEARRLGLSNTRFTNASGFSNPQHYSTANDLAKLSVAILRDYPQHYPLFGLREFTFNNFSQANRNRLLWLDPYADGIKTGRTQQAGYCLVGSVKRGERRLISVLLGAESDTLRASESQKLLNFGFQNFDTVRLYHKEQTVTTARLWEGTDRNVPLGFQQDVFLTVPKGQLKQLQATLETSQPLLAPLSSGQQLGVMKLTLAGKPFAELPVVALKTVPLANIFSRGWDNIHLLIHKLLQ